MVPGGPAGKVAVGAGGTVEVAAAVGVAVGVAVLDGGKGALGEGVWLATEAVLPAQPESARRRARNEQSANLRVRMPILDSLDKGLYSRWATCVTESVDGPQTTR